jgi:arsenate reductase
MEIAENEMLLVYNSGTQSDRTALGYAKAVKDYKLREVDIKKDAFTETQLKEIANKLGVNPMDLVDRQSDIFKDKYKNSSMNENDVLTVLSHEPDIMRTPIVLYKDKGAFVDSKYEFVKRGMASPDITSEHANKEERSDDKSA